MNVAAPGRGEEQGGRGESEEREGGHINVSHCPYFSLSLPPHSQKRANSVVFVTWRRKKDGQRKERHNRFNDISWHRRFPP